VEAFPPEDPAVPGELPLTPALKSAFCASLAAARIALSFSAGAWSRFAPPPAALPFDIVLTSETIYNTDSVDSLIALMRCACLRGVNGDDDEGLAASVAKLGLGTLDAGVDAGVSSEVRPPSLCLVAAKVFYFGVGGGVSDFVERVGSVGRGTAETVWERKSGVARQILRLQWHP
jgi:protein-histidine N-methyltransferase